MSHPDIVWTNTTNLPRLLEILAGGRGSGCHGPNCGRPRGVKQVYQTHSGVTYTIFNPSRKGIAKGQQKVKEYKKVSKLKGTYKQARMPNNDPIQFKSKGRFSNAYDAWWKKGDKYEGHGQTVFVHRDFANMRVTVVAVPHDEMQKSDTPQIFRFKNFGQAAGFLNKRYGIKQALPKPGEATSGLKRGRESKLADVGF